MNANHVLAQKTPFIQYVWHFWLDEWKEQYVEITCSNIAQAAGWSFGNKEDEGCVAHRLLFWGFF
jgi:hypothetical protein